MPQEGSNAAQWIPLIGSMISAAGSIGAGRRQRKNIELANKHARAMADYGYAKDLEMWERQNAYNSPVAQMMRLKEAGLNPNLVYGNGAVGNSGGQVPRFDPPRLDFNYQPTVDLPAMLSAYQDFSVRQAQADNLKAQTDNIRARTVSESTRNVLMQLQGEATKSKTRATDLGSDIKQSLWPYEAQIKEFGVRQTQADLQETLKKLLIMDVELINKQLETHARQRGLTTQDLENERKQAENLFLKYRNDFMKQGITTSDHPILRILSRMFSEGQISLGGSAGPLDQGGAFK